MPNRRLFLTGITVLALTAACAALDSNPLLGRWVASSPALPGMTLGTYEFRRSSMTALGVDQGVDYVVSGDTVTVTPRGGPGIGLEIQLVDRNTARVNVPVLGGLVTLRRASDRGWF